MRISNVLRKWRNKREPPWHKAIGLPRSGLRTAQSLVPDTAFAANEDRPALVLLDIERVKRGHQAGAGNGVDGGVVQTEHDEPDSVGCSCSRW